MSAVQPLSSNPTLGVLLPAGADWRELAVCKGRTNLFFPPKAERPQARARREARANLLCSNCPVKTPYVPEKPHSQSVRQVERASSSSRDCVGM